VPFVDQQHAVTVARRLGRGGPAGRSASHHERLDVAMPLPGMRRSSAVGEVGHAGQHLVGQSGNRVLFMQQQRPSGQCRHHAARKRCEPAHAEHDVRPHPEAPGVPPVEVAPGIGFGDYGDDHVRIALIENEHRLRQAVRGIRDMFRKDGLLRGAA